MRKAFLLVAVVTVTLAAFTTSSALAAQRPAKVKRAAVYTPPQGWPQKFMMPRFGVTAPVESLAFNRPADVHAPYRWGDVAWYDLGAKPGALGHAVIFGHLDSTCCPAVFYQLRNIKPGDTVQVQYKTGHALNFRVIWSHTYPNADLPVKFMYAAAQQRGLVLVTCTGVFHTDGTGYDHKFVVYARLILPNGKLG